MRTFVSTALSLELLRFKLLRWICSPKFVDSFPFSYLKDLLDQKVVSERGLKQVIHPKRRTLTPKEPGEADLDAVMGLSGWHYKESFHLRDHVALKQLCKTDHENNITYTVTHSAIAVQTCRFWYFIVDSCGCSSTSGSNLLNLIWRKYTS